MARPKTPLNPPNTAVIYARYSSHNQRDVSIEQQVQACRQYAAENNLEVIRVYEDHAMTGTNDNRPEFQQMILDSASRAFSFVVVYTLDRFSRDRYDSAVHKHTLKENGVKVLSAMENIQDNPVGVLMESVLEGFAEYYSKELAQKIRRGMRDNAEKCMVNGPLPYGYRKGKDGRYEIIPEEARIIREIYQRVICGEMFISILNDLNTRGVPTKSGGKWNKSSFNTLLHNPKYIGVYQYQDVIIEDGVPAILDKETFDMAQERCKTKPHAQDTPLRRRRNDSVYLLTGKLYCGECKSPMIGMSGTSHGGKLYSYYSCRAHMKDKHSCTKKPIPRDTIESLVAEQIKKIISRDDILNWLVDSTIDYMENNRETEEIKLLRERLAAVQNEKKNTLKAIRLGVVAQSVQDMLMQLEADESSLSAKLALAQDRAKLPFSRDLLAAFIESFRDGEVENKRFQEQLIDAFLIRAYLYKDHLKIIFASTGNSTEEVEVPFDIDNAEEKATDSFEIEESAESLGSSKDGVVHLQGSSTNKIYMIYGYFVIACALQPKLVA